VSDISSDTHEWVAGLATPDDYPMLAALRRQVFVEEQGVPVELENDELDEGATHAVARGSGGEVLGTGRLLVPPGGVARIGRMAVSGGARGRGVGSAILRVLEDAAAGMGCHRAELHAQVHAVGFYRLAGYEQQGGPFDDAGIPHVAMAKALPKGHGAHPAAAPSSAPASRPATGPG